LSCVSRVESPGQLECKSRGLTPGIALEFTIQDLTPYGGGEMVADFAGEIAARRARLEKIGDYL
jgi:hypothetical protein